VGDVKVFGQDNLYDLVDGQADSFFAYRFEQVAVQTYERDQGATLRVEIWQLANDVDAFGLYTTFRAGSMLTVGNEGDGDLGRRASFWQARYYVHIFALEEIADADLTAFARAVSSSLPTGGAQPELLAYLPRQGLVERSEIYFHEEISIQSYLWLGGENPLRLDSDTNAVLARYESGSGVVQLLLVQYPDAQSASAGLQAMRAAEITGVLAVRAEGNLLAGVFGVGEQAAAQELVAATLGDG
jgi:hypothetical protein